MAVADLSPAESLAQLYELTEVFKLSGVPIAVAIDTLKLVNPALQMEHAQAIVSECDSRGNQLLTAEDFHRAVALSLSNTPESDAVQAVRDAVLRLRLAFRRRFLMYDAPMGTPPPGLMENRRTVDMFRELFDYVGHGQEYITRNQLRMLANLALHDFKADAGSVCKAALGEPENDFISFNEFVMVVQPATMRRCLSDMISIVRNATDSTGALKGSAGYERPSSLTAPSPKLLKLQASHKAFLTELRQYQLQDEVAQRRMREVVGERPVYPSIPPLPEAMPPQMSAAMDQSEKLVAQLRLENEKLKRQILELQMDRPIQSAPLQQDVSPHDEKLERRVEYLQEELRRCRAHLAAAQESSELIHLLKQGANFHSAVRDFFPDESVLVSKLGYVRDTASLIDDGTTAISTVLSQYDLVVVGYQALYRDLRKKYETLRPKQFDAVKAAASIVPVTPVRDRTPTLRRGPVSVRASPMRWKDLDREPTDDMKRSGTLADPLLTAEERNLLRAKLAAQMRNSARRYTPTRRGQASRGPSVTTVMTSVDALERLQSLGGYASRERRLDR